MQKLYGRIVWENEPSTNTPLNEQNLNRMDAALNNLDDRVISQESIKADKAELNNLVADWQIDEETGIITITKKNGERILFDLNIEKIPVSFSLSDDGILTMVTDDGTVFSANIGAMIPILTFADSEDIAVSVSGSGVNKTYSFSIKHGSITRDKLNPDFLSDMEVAAANAESYALASEESAKEAESYARGGTNIRDGEDTDNALYYKNQSKIEADRAKEEADRAGEIVGIGIATTEKAGIVKPDGETTKVDEDGTLRVIGSSDLSALTLPYNGPDDTETTKEVVDSLKIEVEGKADETQLDEKFGTMGIVPDGTNLNDIITPGSYWLSHNYSYINIPTSITNGIMLVYKEVSTCKQIILRRGVFNTNDDNTFIRSLYVVNGEVQDASEWVKYLTEKDGTIPTKASDIGAASMEKGIWTPKIALSNDAYTAKVSKCTYSKIGDTIFLTFACYLISSPGNISLKSITGLPFVSHSGGGEPVQIMSGDFNFYLSSDITKHFKGVIGVSTNNLGLVTPNDMIIPAGSNIGFRGDGWYRSN